MPKIIMLAGAPGSTAWEEKDLTVNNFLSAFKHVLGEDECHSGIPRPGTSQASTEPDASHPLPVWRSIPLKQTHLPTGWTQRDWEVGLNHGSLVNGSLVNASSDQASQLELSFLTTTSMTSADEIEADTSPVNNAELSQHLEQSFALHEEAHSSQVTPAAKTPLLRRTHTQAHHNTDFAADTSPAASSAPATENSNVPADPKSPFAHQPRIQLPYLTDLAALPAAAALTALEPQTVTVDLLVGVISVCVPRTVTIRRTGRAIELVEVLVGDETRTGFCVTFWLAGDDGLRSAVQALRPGDVVGVRNAALGHFRHRVHGQSLGGRRGGKTSVVRFAEAEKLGGRKVVEKFERVRAWTRDFVRPVGRTDGGMNALKRKRSLVDGDDLPPDETQ